MPEYHDALSIEKFSKDEENCLYNDIESKTDLYYSKKRNNCIPLHLNDINSTSYRNKDSHICYQCYTDIQKLDIIDKRILLNEDLFLWSNNDSEQKDLSFDNAENRLSVDGSILVQLHINDSILDLFPTKRTKKVYRLLYAPGDMVGHVDLLNGQRYTETCKCITNTLVRH